MKNLSLLSIWWLSLAVKLVLGSSLPLFADETYYWVWSHDLQLSYFDHPPMVAYLFSLGHYFEPYLHAVRIPALILTHLSLLIWLRILKDYLSPEATKLWLYLSLLSPLFGAGALVVTPDIPLMFFWSLSVYLLIQVLKTPSRLNFFLLGFSLGLGFLSKYNIVIFIPIATLIGYKHQKLKINLIPHYGIAILAFMAASSPVWIWNYQNDFMSFRFQTTHGLGARTWQASWTLGFIFEQVLIIGPAIYFATRKTFQLSNDSENSSLKNWIFASLAWGPLIFFLLATFKGRAEANWPLVAYPAFFALALRASPKQANWAKYTSATWCLLIALFVSQIFWNWLPIPPNAIKHGELTRYLPMEKALKANPQFRPVYARTFQMASNLSYALKESVLKLNGFNRFDYFDTLDASVPSVYPFYLITIKSDVLPDWLLQSDYTIETIHNFNKIYYLLKVSKN